MVADMGKKCSVAYALAALLLFSCAREEAMEDLEIQDIQPGRVLYAELEDFTDAGTRAFFELDYQIRWAGGERISVFDRNTANREYRFTGSYGDTAGSFEMVSGGTGTEISRVYAVTPYRETDRVCEDGSALQVSYDGEQLFRGVTVARQIPMVSAGTDDHLLFRSICGFLQVRLHGNRLKISSVSLRGNRDEPLSGTAIVRFDGDGEPLVDISAATGREIRITDYRDFRIFPEVYTEALFLLPPVEFTEGFTLTVTLSDGRVFEQSTQKPLRIERNHLYRMKPVFVDLTGEEVPPDHEIWYTESSHQELNLPAYYYTYSSVWGARLVSDELAGFQGVLTFDGPVTHFEGGSWAAPLKSVYMPPTVESFSDSNPFFCCDALEAIHGKYATPDGRCLIKDGALLAFAPSGISSYTVPEGVAALGGRAFLAGSVRQVGFPASLQEIGPWAFSRAFRGDDGAVRLAESVSSVAPEAFAETHDLQIDWGGMHPFRDVYLLWALSCREQDNTLYADYPEESLADYLQEAESVFRELADEVLSVCQECRAVFEETESEEVRERALMDAAGRMRDAFPFLAWEYGLTEFQDAAPSGNTPDELETSAMDMLDAAYRLFCDRIEEFTGRHPSGARVPVTGVSLDREVLEMAPGDAVRLTATVLPEDASHKAVVWSCADSYVASVSEAGVVTARGIGSTTVTVHTVDGNYSASCRVEVAPWRPEAVDLGLSVPWASCNVGATRPTEYGGYFAWGEVQPKQKDSFGQYQSCGWAGYRWCEGEPYTLTKYNSDPGYGVVDYRIELEAEDDAATVVYGGKWRMPTDREVRELVDNCTWTWTTQGSVAGYQVTSPVTGNSIFLPAAGYIVDYGTIGRLYYDGEEGGIWSSTAHPVKTVLSFSASRPGYYLAAPQAKPYSVRAVCGDRHIVYATEITLSDTEMTLAVGDRVYLRGFVAPDDVSNKDLYYSSADPSVASVEDSWIRALAPGTTTIEVISADGRARATCRVTVQ